MTKLYNYVKYSFLSFWENKRSVPVNIRKKPWFTPKSKTARKKIHLAKKGNKSKNNDATIKISSFLQTSIINFYLLNNEHSV